MRIAKQDFTQRRLTKRLLTGLYTVTVLFLVSLRPVLAQTVPAHLSSCAAGNAGACNNAEEVTIAGKVSSVLTKAEPGMMVGSHLLLATSSGNVDASLGRFGLRLNDGVSFAEGQQVEATGVIRMINSAPVLVVRTLKVEDEVYVIRNKHGFPLSPQARERASQIAQKGELQ